jgi:hypothetical protein
MNPNSTPRFVRDKLLALSAQHEHVTEKVARTNDAIASARVRLSGKFQTDAEHNDLSNTLKKLIADLPTIEARRDTAEHTLESCQAWIDELPDNTTLEIVKVKSNGADLAAVRELIRNAEDELQTLERVPTPSADIELHVRDYVASLGRPTVLGAEGNHLQVTWPQNAVALFALLMPDRMTEIIFAEVDRAANDPMPLPQRKQRIAELKQQIDELQRTAYALGHVPYDLDPAIILGVRVVRREQVKKVERRVVATEAMKARKQTNG